MLIATFGDPSKPQTDPLPDNWRTLESASQEGLLGITSFGRKFFPDNFGVVVPGKLYRSAIPWMHQVEELHGTYGIKNIVSLIGGGWLDEDELEALGITHYQYDVLQRRALTKEKVQMIVEKMQSLEGPTLVHCLKGATRTGQVIAGYQLKVEGLSRMRVYTHALRHGLVNTSAYREISKY